MNSVALVIAMAVGAQLSSPAYIWTPLAWLAWFLYATHGFRGRDQNLVVQTAKASATEGQIA